MNEERFLKLAHRKELYEFRKAEVEMRMAYRFRDRIVIDADAFFADVWTWQIVRIVGNRYSIN